MTNEQLKTCELCVPYKKDKKYLLYSVTYNDIKDWNLDVENKDEEKITKRFDGFNDYFKNQCNPDKCYGKFGFKARPAIEIVKKEDKYLILETDKNNDKSIKNLTDDCISILLGIFLRAAEQIQRYKLKKEILISVTGAIEYKSGELRLLEVQHIVEKYTHKFYNIAEENKNQKFLFIYINNDLDENELKKSKKSELDNVTIKRYTTANTIWDIYKEVFEPVEVSHEIEEYGDDQQEFIKHMKNEVELDYGKSYGYIEGDDFNELIKNILHELKWKGYFIYGVKGTGKSATAMAIAEYLTYINKITAPIWINFGNPNIKKFIEKRPLNINKIEEYIITSIKDLIISEKNNKYLIVIDHLAIDKDDINQVFQMIKKLFDDYTFTPYLIITSRVFCKNSFELLGLQKERVSKLNKEQIAAIIKNVAKKEVPNCEIEINEAKEKGKFNNLINSLFEKYAHFPLIIINIIKHKIKNIKYLSKEIEKNQEWNIPEIQQIIIDIFWQILKKSDELQDELRYGILATLFKFGGRKALSIDEIYNIVIKMGLLKKVDSYLDKLGDYDMDRKELLEILETLCDINFLSLTYRKRKPFYKINDIPYKFIEKEFYFLRYDSDYVSDYEPKQEDTPASIQQIPVPSEKKPDRKSKLTRNKLIIGIIAAGIIAISVIFLFILPNKKIIFTHIKEKTLVHNVKKYYKRGDYDNTIIQCGKIINFNKENSFAYSLRGAAYKKIGQYYEAINDFKEAIRIDPNDYFSYLNRGDIYRVKKYYYDDAIIDFNYVIMLDPDNSSAYSLRGDVYLYLTRSDQAIKDFNDAIMIDPNNSFAYFGRGDAYRMKDLYDEAIKDLDEAIRIDPGNSFAYSSRGDAYRMKNLYDQALRDLNEAIKLDNYNSFAYICRGSVYFEIDNTVLGYRIAKKDLDKACELNPVCKNYSYDFANKLKKSAQNNEKREDYYEYMIYYSYGGAYRHFTKYDTTIRYLNEIIKFDPKNNKAYKNRGEAYRQHGEYTIAIIDFSEAIRLDPSDSVAYCNRGKVYMDNYHLDDNYDKAIKDFTEAIRLDPNNLSAYYNRGKLYLDHSYFKDDNYDEAIKDFTEVIRLDPNFSFAYDGRGRAYLEESRYYAAIKDFTEFIRLEPNNYSGYFERGRIYRLIEDIEKAAHDFNKAFSLNNEDWIKEELDKIMILNP